MIVASRFFTATVGIFVTFALLWMYSSIAPLSRSQSVNRGPAEPAVSNPAASPDSSQVLEKIEDAPFSYDPIGKRDPFSPFKVGSSLTSKEAVSTVHPPKTASTKASEAPEAPEAKVLPSSQSRSNDPLVKYELTKYKVVGIMWDVSTPRAVILSPDNKVFTVNKNAKLGNSNGRIAEIKEGEIVVIEKAEGAVGNPNAVVLTLEQGISE
jgi:type IV pilus assembly protein PilP